MKYNFPLKYAAIRNKTALHFQSVKENAMPLFFSSFAKTYPFAKMYIFRSPQPIPPVNQFPHTHFGKLKTHIHFYPKSAEAFDLPGFSRQQSDRLNMFIIVQTHIFTNILKDFIIPHHLHRYSFGSILTFFLYSAANNFNAFQIFFFNRR